MSESLRKAVQLLREGRFVLIHDFESREDEVDIVLYAKYVNPEAIYIMRTLGGGLICYATSRKVAEALGLKYMSEILSAFEPLSRLTKKRLRYGDPPAFSIWVNHVGVRTGISDRDRALTIYKLHEVTEKICTGRIEEGRNQFYEEFVSPGHVPILIGRTLAERRGHTELSLALAVLAELLPSVVLVELLDRGISLSAAKARELALKLNTVLVEADEIIEAFEKHLGGEQCSK